MEFREDSRDRSNYRYARTYEESFCIALATRTERVHPYTALYITQLKQQRLWRLPVLKPELLKGNGSAKATPLAYGSAAGRSPLIATLPSACYAAHCLGRVIPAGLAT